MSGVELVDSIVMGIKKMKTDEDLNSLLGRYMDQKKLYNLEGRRGFENLCKLVEVLGYKDSQYFGQMSNGACIGSLVNFFEDNSGAIQAVVEWVSSQNSEEWREILESEVGLEGE